jgi:hypothetical protein
MWLHENILHIDLACVATVCHISRDGKEYDVAQDANTNRIIIIIIIIIIIGTRDDTE